MNSFSWFSFFFFFKQGSAFWWFWSLWESPLVLGWIQPSIFIPDTEQLHPAEFSMRDVCVSAKSMRSRNVLCRSESQITPSFSIVFPETSVSENSVARTGARMHQMLYQQEFNSLQTHQATPGVSTFSKAFESCYKSYCSPWTKLCYLWSFTVLLSTHFFPSLARLWLADRWWI